MVELPVRENIIIPERSVQSEQVSKMLAMNYFLALSMDKKFPMNLIIVEKWFMLVKKEIDLSSSLKHNHFMAR
jgi:hypothetical protein